MEGIGLHGLCVTLWLKWAPDPWAGIAPTNRTSSGAPFWLQFAMINFTCAAKAVAGELESVISSAFLLVRSYRRLLFRVRQWRGGRERRKCSSDGARQDSRAYR